MIPFAVMGLTFGSLNLIHILSFYKRKAIFFCLVIIVFLFKFNMFFVIKGIFYPGIERNLGAIILFSLFSIITVKSVINEKIFLIIGRLTKYTGGIYYLHVFIKFYLKKKISLVKKKTISGCIIIYIFCYFICFIGIIIFKKTKLKYLFY